MTKHATIPDPETPAPAIDLSSGKYLKLWQGPQHPGITGNMSVELTVCGDEVAHAKPAPDIFLAAAKALGVPAEECLVLEDSPNGLRAAKAAGCKAVVVPDITPIPPESEGLWAASAVTLADVIPLLAQL